MAVQPLYKDTNLSIEARVSHLVAQMSIEEKVAQLYGIWTNDLYDQSRQFSIEKARQNIPHGVGHITRIGAVAMLPPVKSAQLANAIQKYLVEETRLGIPGIVHEESCAGYLAKDATTFPQAIGLAATWEPELIQRIGDVIRQQMRAVGAHHTLAPVLDVARDPRWGRMEETFGEDPFLVSAIGVAYIRGIQGEDWAQRVVATAKHFIGYSASEGGLNWAPAHIPERELREVFLPPFAAAIQEADVRSVMNAYQEIDGIPLGSSKAFMVDLLRNELGFDGVVASDYFTLAMFMNYHHIAHDRLEAARFGLEAGIDIELPASDCYGQALIDALKAGTIHIDLVDVCVARVLTMKCQLGLFENPYVSTEQIVEVYNTPDQLTLSQEAARKSIVLLKNEGGLLPLSDNLKRIAVIGPNANSARLMQGDYHFPAHFEGITNLAALTEAPVPGRQGMQVDWESLFPPTTTVLEGIRQRISADTEIVYAHGCDVTGVNTEGFAEAVEIASQSEVAILVVGDKSGLGKDATSGEAVDRATLELPGVQQQLIEAIHATGTPTIVVLMNGRPTALTWIADHIPAVLEVWLPAQEGGHAVSSVLFGDANPGGKLPVSFPRDAGQVPVYYSHKPSGGRSHWHGEYIDMSTKPLFPFGYGLSYTTFAYSDLHILPAQSPAHGEVEIRCNVINTGQVVGDEVVQLYVHDPVASVTRPVKLLKGFKRLTLQPGECRTITFHLDLAHLGFYDRSMTYVIEPGEIEVMIGSSSEDIRLQGAFEIIGETTVVKPVYFTSVKIN